MTVPARPLVLGGIVQATVLLLLGATVGLGAAGWLAGIVFAAGTWVLLGRSLEHHHGHRWGPADTVTFGRLILTGGVIALTADAVAGSTHHVALIGLAAVSLACDGVDGQIARRTGATSAFGARFDMEADSVLAIALSVYLGTTLGWWAVGIGLFRYAYVLASYPMPWLNGALPPRFSRKVVAASQGAVLVVTSAGLLPVPLARACIAVSIASLVWSFGKDVRWLWQRESLRRAAPWWSGSLEKEPATTTV
ncbi:CDP-alcohol phosphatidyltransferase family protein [Actinoplanes flavus]|uniref:CDP-alcohol phosphatidyltransferase family protein n=1 Tax=Actinoplanes flavus TaxID=2820290 RepID=A0ABS3UHV3_9ACTN|nr:CDP-alcohol phosphatidyltransferase family protein [Actinoplanes flavus]MBO3738353.1 CDP-alcohol phosphatidyltransferase family protein [Actinoplanes flavus]